MWQALFFPAEKDMPYLVIVRHGQSVWNLENRFTGWVDVELTDTGRAEAAAAGDAIKALNISFDTAFTSALMRAQHTLDIILAKLGQQPPVSKDQALNERMYGDLQGLNKAETAAKFGDEQVHIWRRSYDVPPPNGESLKDTAARVLPYFKANILPQLQQGKNILVVAHGNSLRALIMFLEGLKEEEIPLVELPTAVPKVYQLDTDLKVQSARFLK